MAAKPPPAKKSNIQIVRKAAVRAPPASEPVLEIGPGHVFSTEPIGVEEEQGLEEAAFREGPLRIREFAKSMLKLKNMVKVAEEKAEEVEDSGTTVEDESMARTKEHARPQATVKESCPRYLLNLSILDCDLWSQV